MISSSVGFRPRVLIKTPNSLALMNPSPFWKKSSFFKWTLFVNVFAIFKT
jgi:hypothetical protein